jgi:putative transposase
LCGLFGKTRQSWYYKQNQEEKRFLRAGILYGLIKERRKDLPRVGGKKLYHMLQEDLAQHQIKIGRDKFFDFMRESKLLVKPKRKFMRTTNSMHRFRKYPNLVLDYVPNASNQLYVSDITYVRLEQGFAYLSLVTDAYSRKIVGYKLYPSLSTKGCLLALQMAISNLPLPSNDVIHHSDRGIQYCSTEYIRVLNQHCFQISMTNNGDPYENAIAERVNGILKDEFDLDKTFKNYNEAQKEVALMIFKYNQLRPHLSCNFMTPESAHEYHGELVKKW